MQWNSRCDRPLMYSSMVIDSMQSMHGFPGGVNAENEHGHTALFVAAACGQIHTVRQLLRIDNIDVNHASTYRRTPLFAAAYRCHHAVVAALLKHPSIEVNRPDMYGRTPLHATAVNGWVDGAKRTTQLLLGHPDTNVNAKDIRGHTPLHLTIRHLGFASMQVLLQAPKIDFTATNKQGFTALQIAEIFGHNSLVESINRSKRSQQARKSLGLFRCATKMVILSRRLKEKMYAPGGSGARAAIERLQRNNI